MILQSSKRSGRNRTASSGLKWTKIEQEWRINRKSMDRKRKIALIFEFRSSCRRQWQLIEQQWKIIEQEFPIIE